MRNMCVFLSLFILVGCSSPHMESTSSAIDTLVPLEIIENTSITATVIEPSPTILTATELVTQPTIVSLPGNETFPVSELLHELPWQPLDPNAVPLTSYIAINFKKPPMDDVLVRQAFSLGVDREYLATRSSEISGQPYFPASVLTPPEVLGRNLYGAVGLTFNPDQAKEKLSEAGYPAGEGFPQVVFLYFSNPNTDGYVNSIITTWFEVLGVQVIPKPAANQDEYFKLLREGDFHMLTSSWIADMVDPHNFLNDLVLGVDFLSAFENAEYIQLIDTAAVMLDDPAKRQLLYIDAERILCEQETVIIPVSFRTVKR